MCAGIEYPLAPFAGETRRTLRLRRSVSPRRQQRRIRRHHGSELQEIVFVAASTVQEKERRRSFPLRRHEAVGEFACHDAAFSRTGSTPSISLRRGSRKFGSSKSRPRASTGSSTANPGRSVAISKRTPPG